MGGKHQEAMILARSIPFRLDFHKALKTPKELPEEWLIRVKELAQLCCFGESCDLFVLDKFITGFETEITDHLCSRAECLDINKSLEIIQTYESEKYDHNQLLSLEAHSADGIEQTETIFSEILMKCDDETLKATDNENEDCLDKLIDENNIDSCSSDCNESSTKKRYKTHRKPKVSTEKQSANEQIDVDPNAPKKKRKYKKRAVKEKQMFECETCHYKCYHECHLRRHKLIHLNEKSFVCHMCGKAFNLFINLNAHIRRHVGFKPHVCEVCNTSFMDKTRLKLHMRTHTGEKPFGCTVCDKRFADRYYLKVHMRLHTGEKPFQCNKCHKSFSQSSSLSTHRKKNCLIKIACKSQS